MAVEHHTLAAFTPVAPADLRLRQALALRGAIEGAVDFALVEALAAAGGSGAEALVVDVECTEVPNRNPVGVRTRERLALVISPSEDRPPDVLALRKDFPNVMHLNMTRIGAPRSLCLNFEPRTSVMRSWTAPKFLRRIQWWLVQTALGTLHAADQPVELPFFDTGWELVLPADFDNLRRRHEVRFQIQKQEPVRKNGTATLMLVPRDGRNVAGAIGVAIIDCPPIVQRTRTEIPSNLGEAADELRVYGIEFVPLLRTQLQEQVAQDGEPSKGAGDFFVILLNIPVSRALDAPPEKTQRLAFLTLLGKLQLGLLVGAYYRSAEGKVFKDTLIGDAVPQEGNWQGIETLAAEVLQMPDRAMLRMMSATPKEGPGHGVLIGAGALGSELLNLWTRAGWGNWTVVDSDHVKPHNLARHSAFASQVGTPKANSVALLAACVLNGEPAPVPIVADVCAGTSEDFATALAGSDLVVDCSTTVDFPRAASRSAYAARHASAFLTPSGEGSVLLVEDAGRTRRLRTLEAQYYRAILNSSWGRHHLDGNLGTFWSGASCRDISYKLPHSAIIAHAATLAEQVGARTQQPDASIQVWHRDRSSGAVQVFNVPAHASDVYPLGGMQVHLDDGLKVKLRALRESGLPAETGGVLLGFHDLNLGEIVIVDALPPPPDSKASEQHFDRGSEGLREAVEEANRRTGNMVSYVGEWHSHPRRHSTRQSTTDLVQLAKLATQMAQDGLPMIQLIVGDGDISVYAAEVVH
jgi:integrative and conjugative element protein (TIGR02256 family)